MKNMLQYNYLKEKTKGKKFKEGRNKKYIYEKKKKKTFLKAYSFS